MGKGWGGMRCRGVWSVGVGVAVAGPPPYPMEVLQMKESNGWVKVTQELKNIQVEQMTKLQAKHQAECELLEDIRELDKYTEEDFQKAEEETTPLCGKIRNFSRSPTRLSKELKDSIQPVKTVRSKGGVLKLCLAAEGQYRLDLQLVRDMKMAEKEAEVLGGSGEYSLERNGSYGNRERFLMTGRRQMPYPFSKMAKRRIWGTASWSALP
ncbi:hypothetical protein QYF61_016813 [Mycteria americana]|uniref:Uncharacterized protein n=1 Tax=Mycteria americana TaxID=33587 RepID=A0AAN7NVS5_MYCAM|nr:hypothetical protein QYF61_016813 [Mycteria americana]